jgi:hypothetical protein
VISPAVYWIWGATLVIVTLIIVPLAIYLLHRTFRAAKMIEQHTRESLDAAVRIKENTAAVAALDETIAAATSLLESTRLLQDATGAIAETVGGKSR